MAPTISQALGFYEDNPSILAYEEDADFDFGDDWSEQRTCSSPRWRNSCPDKKTTVSTRWSSRLTSLSSTVIGAGTALTTHAKQLGVGESTQRAMSQLRKSMVEVSSRTERSLRAMVSAQLSEADIGRFGSAGEQPEAEKSCYDDEEDDRSDHLETDRPSKGRCEDKLKQFHPSRSWTQDCA
ncbi:hypothetical protein PRIC1_014446 [Phytophthora ramorum]